MTTLADALANGHGIERYLSRCIEDENSCWLWPGAKTDGYGVVNIKGKMNRLHRLVYQTLVGSIPDDLQLDHLCRVRNCCNPAHVEPVTHKVNSLRGVGTPAMNAVKTHCSRGHEFTEENTRITSEGWRNCRRCHADYERSRRARAHAC